MCGCLLWALYWEPGPQPRHVPWLGIELVTLWLTAHAQSTELHQTRLFSYSFNYPDLTGVFKPFYWKWLLIRHVYYCFIFEQWSSVVVVFFFFFFFSSSSIAPPPSSLSSSVSSSSKRRTFNFFFVMLV